MNIDQELKKVRPPTLPLPILHRESLVSMLADAIAPSKASYMTPHKLILICAPAGYGKTTLLADTIKQLSLPCCWYFFDSADGEAFAFLRTLLTSVQTCFPTVGKYLSTWLHEDSDAGAKENWESLLDALLDMLHAEIQERYVIALCNYHKVHHNKIINGLVNRLLARLPQQCILIIESRALPNLDLASLIAHRQFFGLGSGRLCFSAEEIYELAHLQGFTLFSLQDAELFARTFEGWIAGILLGSELGYTQLYPLAPPGKGTRKSHTPLADRRLLSTYITDEIFSQDAAMYEFLKAVSIFDQLTPEYCNALLEIDDAAKSLIYAEQQGLFVTHHEDTTKSTVGTYHCHPVLQELFRENLRLQSTKRFRDLHRRAAEILQNDQQYEQAWTHAILAQEYDLAISIIISIAPGLIDRGEGDTISHWLAMLPEQMVKQNPWLLLVQANIHLARNEYALVAPLLNAMEMLLDTPSSEQNPSRRTLLQIEHKLAYSKLLFYQRDFPSVQKFCLQVLNMLPLDEYSLRIKAHHRLGVCLIVGSGRIYEGISHLQQALQLSGVQKEERQTATLHRLLASAYGWIGNYTLADYHQMQALRIWEHLDEPRGIINTLTGMGLLKLRQGLTQKAEEVLKKALHLACDVYHFTSGEAYALVALGELYCTQAQYIQALTYLEQGLRLAHACADYYLIHCCLCSLATTYLFMDEIQTGQFFLNQVVLKEEEEQSYEGLLHCLTQAMILLAQQAYLQAQQGIEQAIMLAKQTNIQFLYIQALLLFAICNARQQKMREALETIEQAVALNKKGNFDYTFAVVLRRYPELQSLLDQPQQQLSSVMPNDTFKNAELSVSPPIQLIVANDQNSAHKLDIIAFGDPVVLLDDTPITHWHTARSLELFFLLLEKASPIHKDLVIDALWPHTTSKQIDATMRTAIYYLRQVIGKSCVLYRSGFCSLNLSAGYGQQVSYDVALFESDYEEGKKFLENGDEKAAKKAFTHIVELYKGDYLQSFYNDWCISRRDQLRQVYMDALQQLALIAWRNELWEESLQQWQHLLAMDTCFEKAHYGIMRCYLQLGKRELALRQYQRCCQYLQEELHVAPNASIQKLYQRIIQLIS